MSLPLTYLYTVFDDGQIYIFNITYLSIGNDGHRDIFIINKLSIICSDNLGDNVIIVHDETMLSLTNKYIVLTIWVLYWSLIVSGDDQSNYSSIFNITCLSICDDNPRDNFTVNYLSFNIHFALINVLFYSLNSI